MDMYVHNYTVYNPLQKISHWSRIGQLFWPTGILNRKVLDHGIFVTVWEYKWALHNVDYMYNVD